MIRTTSSTQLTIAEFDWPFEKVLDKNNRWVKLSECIPWDELAENYYQGLPTDRGRPLKDARLVIGAVIIKHKLLRIPANFAPSFNAIMAWLLKASILIADLFNG